MREAEPAAARPRRFRLASPGTALAVAAVVLALLLAQLPLSRLARQDLTQSSGGTPFFEMVPFEIVGSVLQDAVDLDTVRDDLAGVVQTALEPAHLAVWIRPRD